jgi:dimethylamine/trimethylamine dehydrogenase
MGGLRPQAHAAMRGIKAEGGWAIINTEHCSVHPTSDIMPEVVQTLWDDGDIPGLARMTEAVHAHDALAGIQLAYAAYYNANCLTREVPMGPMARPVSGHYPVQVRAMDRQDIRDLQGWWKAAAQRAKTAGFDIINVDSNFSTIAFQFLSPRNQRTDEYGGPLRNRIRMLKELIEVTRDGCAGACAVSVRLIIDELCGAEGLRAHEEGVEAIALLSELPDLWDIVVGTWADDSPTSRFAEENDHEPFMVGIKKVTNKPVVGVGRFTSPDTMVGLIRRGVLDLIGAARPSIADPFLPLKIKEGRYDDIRECIGCNICVSSHFAMTNLRCTQNPTIGEEWRKGWHPEIIADRKSDATVLVVGAGPAGLECARALGQRGYQVTLTDRRRELGGRVAIESRLPGLRQWIRVRDWRATQLDKMANVSVYLESDMSAADILEFGASNVVLATGARWRADGVGRMAERPIPLADVKILTPDDIMAGAAVEGPIVVYDDDRYYMASVLAEQLVRQGLEISVVTPAAEIASFTANTLELVRTARRLNELGVHMITHYRLAGAASGELHFSHVHTETSMEILARTVVMVTSRTPVDGLFHELQADSSALARAGIAAVRRIGDCLAPSAIFGAVYSGHRFAREFDEPNRLFRRERIDLSE